MLHADLCCYCTTNSGKFQYQFLRGVAPAGGTTDLLNPETLRCRLEGGPDRA
jgi:hypothetical protein